MIYSPQEATDLRLMTAHKILIGTACVFFLFFAVVQWLGISKGQGTPVSAAMGLAAAILLAFYLRTLKSK